MVRFQLRSSYVTWDRLVLSIIASEFQFFFKGQSCLGSVLCKYFTEIGSESVSFERVLRLRKTCLGLPVSFKNSPSECLVLILLQFR